MTKSKIFSFILVLLLGYSTTISSQTKTWIGPSEGTWFDENHWSPMGIPTGSFNVLIPSGSVVNVDSGPPYPFMDTLTVESGATINKYGDNNMTMSQGYFQAGSVLNMYEGKLVSTGLVIDGTVHAIGPLTKGFRNGIIEINNSMTIEAGSGTFTLRDNTLRINPTGTLHLPGDGIMDLSAFSATLENQGLIEKTGGSGDFIIDVPFFNNGGTVNLNSGNMIFPVNGATLSDGVYNVSTGSSMIITSLISHLEGTLTGLLDGPLVFHSSISALDDATVTYNFTGTAQVHWAGGNMNSGEFINEGLITLTDTALAGHTLQNTTLLNNGDIDLVDNCELNLINNGQLHNSSIGTINLLDSNQVNGSFGGLLLNEGLLIKVASAKNAHINTDFINEDGTISVLGDTLVLTTSAGSLNDGQYDVVAGAAFRIYAVPGFNGTLTGQLDGPMELMSDSYDFAETDTTVFDFTGTAQIDWYSGLFVGGNFKNKSTINAKSTETFANQISGLNIINEGLININGVHGIFLSSSTLLNTATGVIDIQTDNLLQCGFGVSNFGLLKKSGGTGVSPINGVFYHDNPGLVHVEIGTLDFSNLQAGNGDFAGAGTLVLGNYEVEGEVSPGNSPGTLSILGNYDSAPTEMLNIELNGNTAGTDFDVLAIDGDAILKGEIDLTMGFAPMLSDQFEIITASNVDSCLLPTTVTAVFEGMTYTYDVICNADNVTLGVTDVSVGLDNLSAESLLTIFPNPMSYRSRIEFTDKTSNGSGRSLVMINSAGQTLRIIPIPNGVGSIDIDRGNLPSGLYHIQLFDGIHVQSSFKLMVE